MVRLVTQSKDESKFFHVQDEEFSSVQFPELLRPTSMMFLDNSCTPFRMI